MVGGREGLVPSVFTPSVTSGQFLPLVTGPVSMRKKDWLIGFSSSGNISAEYLLLKSKDQVFNFF